MYTDDLPKIRLIKIKLFNINFQSNRVLQKCKSKELYYKQQENDRSCPEPQKE